MLDRSNTKIEGEIVEDDTDDDEDVAAENISHVLTEDQVEVRILLDPEYCCDDPKECLCTFGCVGIVLKY